MSKKDEAFLKLQKEWYAKLKDDGFQDAEGDNGQLKTWSSSIFKNYHNGNRTYDVVAHLNDIKEEYFRLTGYFLGKYDFARPLDREIWELHSQGRSKVAIYNLLKIKYEDCTLYYIKKIIKLFKKLMLRIEHE